MSKKRRAANLLAPPVLVETAERRQHSPVVDQQMKMKSGHGVERARRVLYEHPLDVMLHRALILDGQHEAGIRVRQYAEMSICQTRVISRYDQSPGAAGGPEAEAHARAMLRNALDGLSKREKSVTLGVCAYGEWAGVWALKRGWPIEKGTPISHLRNALSAIARGWKIAA